MPENRFKCKMFFAQSFRLKMAGKVAKRRTIRRLVISERALRPLAYLEDVTDQKARFQELIGEV